MKSVNLQSAIRKKRKKHIPTLKNIELNKVCQEKIIEYNGKTFKIIYF